MTKADVPWLILISDKLALLRQQIAIIGELDTVIALVQAKLQEAQQTDFDIETVNMCTALVSNDALNYEPGSPESICLMKLLEQFSQ